MKRIFDKQAWVLIGLMTVWSCGPEEEPQPALPGYLRIPAVLGGLPRFGPFCHEWGLNPAGGGPERVNPKTNTYSGVLGDITFGRDLSIQFTVGQPLPFKQTASVPYVYQASGTLSVLGTTAPGTYPLNSRAPTPRGEFADLVINLPGPQIYGNTNGSLTITETTLIKSEGRQNLYRVVGSFEATLYANGPGTSQVNPQVSGSFDVLLLDN